eukprot:606194-Amphidinium_carterae.1
MVRLLGSGKYSLCFLGPFVACRAKTYPPWGIHPGVCHWGLPKTLRDLGVATVCFKHWSQAHKEWALSFTICAKSVQCANNDLLDTMAEASKHAPLDALRRVWDGATCT